MKREILFRGKRIDNGQWVEGDLIHNGTNAFSHKFNVGIRVSGYYPIEVIPETVGQFTGLTDKNGVKIFEDDIVTSKHYQPANYRIQFIEGGFCATHPSLEGYPVDINHFYPSVGCCIEIIGNIFENPELLEKAQDNRDQNQNSES